jgi:hypothetical protein
LALLRIEPVVEGKHLKAGDATIVATKPGWMRFDDDAHPGDGAAAGG